MSAVTPTLLLVPAAAVLAGWLGVRLTRRRRPWLRVLVAAVAGVLAFGGALQVWARASLDRSAMARAMVWFEADVDDIDRFPSRPIPAGASLSGCAAVSSRRERWTPSASETQGTVSTR
jgi:hypothetical protein